MLNEIFYISDILNMNFKIKRIKEKNMEYLTRREKVGLYTGEAALNLGRKFIGMEHDKKWFDVAKARLIGDVTCQKLTKYTMKIVLKA